jgi:hypothetical protein
MTAHVIRAYRKEEAGPYPVVVQKSNEMRNPDAGAAQGIDIYSQADMVHDFSSMQFITSLRK